MKTRILLLAAFLIPALGISGPRTSADYTILTDGVDDGGRRTSSSDYTNDGSIGGITGTSTPTSTDYTTTSGVLGQVYEIVGLVLNATPLTVSEGGTLQLAAWQLLDDSTLLAVPSASVTWSVASGPLTSINVTGLATAGIVYQDTAATARGIYLGRTGTLGLTVKNVNLDNFGAYAADAIDDAWQVQYFGQPPNANAGPNVDLFGTGQTNLFKYIAGLNPLDPNSRFTLSIQPVPGQPNQRNLIFSPRLNDRTYIVTSRPSLNTGSFTPLTNPSAPSDNGQQRTITDLSAGGAVKFYRVEITKP